MSLINEALKKAQGDRPARIPPNPAHGSNPPPTGHYSPPPKRNRKSLLWGFLLAVFVVGTFSILLSTFFVLQILKPEESRKAAGDPASTQPVAAIPPAGTSSNPVVAPKDKPEKAPPPASAEGLPTVETVVSLPPEPMRPALPPDPAVIARLMELEIRGIMSGGTRVLIFDQASGRNKAYRVGDSLEGTMGLVVEKISNSAIKFKDYAGQTHTKSF